MKYYDVYVIDRLTHAEVCVGALLSRYDAERMKKFFLEYDVDSVFYEYDQKKGEIRE